MINAGLPLDFNLLPIAICAAGAALAWLTGELTGLLIVATGISIFGGRRASLLTAAAFGLALAVVLLVVGWDAVVEREASLRLAVALAVGLGISGLIHFDQLSSSSGRDEKEARLIVESMPGHGWSADPNGKYIYVSPSTLKYVGETAKSLDRVEGTDEFGWRQVVHPDDYDRVAARWLHSLKTGEPYENEHRIRRFDGEYRWFRNVGMPSRDATGRIAGWYGTTIDIHDQKTAELALRESERQLQQMIDAVPAMIWSATHEGRPAFVNKRFMEVTGTTLEDNTAPDGSPSMCTIHPEDRDEATQILTHSFKTGSPCIRRYRQLRRDGSYRWTETRVEPSRDDSGKILQWYGLGIDIDDLVTAQEELRQSERQLQLLVDAIPAYIWCLTPEGTPSYFNKRVIDQIGFTVKDLTTPEEGLALVSVHPDDRPRVQQALDHSLKTGMPFIEKYRQRRGKVPHRWTEGRAEPLRDENGKIVQWYGVYSDIHEEVIAQQALREREFQLKQLVDMVPSYLWRLEPDGKPNFFNKRLIDFLGLETAFGDKTDTSQLAAIMDTVHPDDTAKLRDALERCLATGERFSMKYRLRRADGVYRWMEGRAEPMRDESGRIVQWYGLSHDIDDQLRVEEALRERERALRQLVETLPAMIDCADPNGEPVYRSQQLREFLGYNLEDLDGSGQSRLAGTLEAGVHPDDLAGVKERYAYSLSTGEPYARRHRLRRFDGEYRWVETRAAAMRNSEGAIVQWNVICLDIDAEVRAQEELRLAQRSLARASQAASLAELSASIAHEVNQPLAAIVATSHACRRWLSANPPNLERAAITLERIIRDAISASEVVSRIRALFSQMGKARSPADITEVIAEVRRLMADELATRKINVETEFERSLPPALIDRVQIQQVFVNLIRNAMDALDVIGDSPKLIRLSAVRNDGNTIRVEVRDLGPGIKEPDRVFDPFFTTKRNGMGMGLAICRSIIESHDGRLWAAANEPRGTTFAFTLPVQASDVA